MGSSDGFVRWIHQMGSSEGCGRCIPQMGSSDEIEDVFVRGMRQMDSSYGFV